MPAPVLQFKRGILSNLPGLRAGEPGFTTDSYELYIGINSTTQENKFFGSHRYWTRETTTTGSGVNLVEGTSNGDHFITLASPASVGAAVTYYFPAANGSASSVLTNDGSGNLSWASGSANPVFTGIATFSNTLVDINSDVDISGITTVSNSTDNTLGNENTGAVQIDGGVGIAKNLTVKENLHVGGYAEFVGVVTFKGGTINIGDNNTDDINVGGEFISGLVPNVDNTHDLGITTQRWRTLNVVNVNTTNLTGTAGTITNFNSTDVSISGISTFTGAIDANGNLDVDGYTELDDVNVSGTLNVVGVSTFTGAIDANGGADISGGETTLSSATVSDLTAGRVVLAGTSGALEDSANLTFSGAGLIVGAGGINVTGVSTFSTDLVVGGDIKIGGNDIQASDGTVAITLAGNDVTVADDLTVQGNLFVNGSTTQVNTAALTVEDRTIDLGIVNGAAPSGNTTWDLGILFNYFSSSTAKKSAVIWEHGDARFKFASVLDADTDGSNVNTPQLTVTTFAPIEIASLFVNDCAGASQVISCTGNERFLENITIDAGAF